MKDLEITTTFPVNIQELKAEAEKYKNNGASHLDNEFGASIDNYMSESHPEFYNNLKGAGELIEYALFYCFKAALYHKSYRNEHEPKLLLFQVSELTYNDIYKEIANDALNMTVTI